METSLRAEWATLYKESFTLLYSTLLAVTLDVKKQEIFDNQPHK